MQKLKIINIIIGIAILAVLSLSATAQDATYTDDGFGFISTGNETFTNGISGNWTIDEGTCTAVGDQLTCIDGDIRYARQLINTSTQNGANYTIFDGRMAFLDTAVESTQFMNFLSKNGTANADVAAGITLLGGQVGLSYCGAGGINAIPDVTNDGTFHQIKIVFGTYNNGAGDDFFAIFVNETQVEEVNEAERSCDPANSREASVLLFGRAIINAAGRSHVNVTGFVSYNGTIYNRRGVNTIPTPTIVFPTPALITSIDPVNINVTFPADAEGDPITITYYLNGELNQTSAGNISLDLDDGTFTVNVSLSDTFDTSVNATVTFTLNTTLPILTVTDPSGTFDVNIPVDLSCTGVDLVSLEYIFFNESGIQDFVINSTPENNNLIIKTTIDISSFGFQVYTFNATCSNGGFSVVDSRSIEIIEFEEKTSQTLTSLLTAGLAAGVIVAFIATQIKGLRKGRSKK